LKLDTEQITFTGFEPPEQNELNFLYSIASALKHTIEDRGGNPDDLIFKSNLGYTTAFFVKLTIFRIKLRGKQHYISLPDIFEDLIPDSYPQKRVNSNEKYIRILINDEHPVESYIDFLTIVAAETLNRYPSAWSCCSHYKECSDAKACVHPNKTFALECKYRKILNSGRIFYGKNRNID